jgi:hypothetical protein
VETTYDGRKLQWSGEAKRALWTLQDAYQRRRAKARVEKSARMRKLDTVTLEFARAVIEEETGVALVLPAQGGAVADAAAAPGGGELRLIARDAKRNPLVSSRDWAAEAVERMFRIPPGFMRQRTQARAEALAAEAGAERVELALVEQALEQGRQAMDQFIQTQAAAIVAAPPPPAPPVAPQPAATAEQPAGRCPWHHAAMDIVRRPEAAAAAREGLYLNEVGILSALEAERDRS